MSLGRFAGGPDDPLLRADIAEDDKRATRHAPNGDAATEVGVDTPTKSPKKEGCSEHAEQEAEKYISPSKEEDADNQEKARAKEVRPVL